MKEVTEEGGSASGVQFEPTTDIKSTGQEKKVILQFRNREDGFQPGLSGLPTLAVPVLRRPQQGAEPVQLSKPDTLLSPWCENCVPVPDSHFGSSFRVFRDATGKCWKCFMPLTCDHAIVIHGAMHSCRVRSREIHEAEALNREVQVSASYHGGRP